MLNYQRVTNQNSCLVIYIVYHIQWLYNRYSIYGNQLTANYHLRCQRLHDRAVTRMGVRKRCLWPRTDIGAL